ncbi:MAG: GspH/FimT family pseudopilin [Nitrospira sp.]
MMRTPNRRASIRSNIDGFSLIELLVTMAIMGLVSTLAGPSFTALAARIQVDLFAKSVASELRWARQWAMTEHDRVRLVFDENRRAIVAQVGSDRVLHHEVSYVGKGIEMDEPSAGSDVVFHPSGRSATATTIQFRNRYGQAHTITVSLNGRVTIR